MDNENKHNSNQHHSVRRFHCSRHARREASLPNGRWGERARELDAKGLQRLARTLAPPNLCFIRVYLWPNAITLLICPQPFKIQS